jgi:hypothetical protein
MIEPPLKKQAFVSQDHIVGFSMKQESTNTTRSIQYHDIQVIKYLLHFKCCVLRCQSFEAKRALHGM